MSLFGTTKDIAPMTAGTDVLRAALLARAHKGAFLAILARELNVGLAAVQEWAHGRGQLSPATLNAMARYIFGDNVTFDAERNLLKRAKQVPAPAGVGPPPFKPTLKVYPLVPPFRPGKPQPVQPKGRAGWAED